MNKVETKQANNAAADKRDGTLECVGGSEALGEDPAQSGLGSPYTAVRRGHDSPPTTTHNSTLCMYSE